MIVNEEYRNSSSINQSLLKCLLQSPQLFLARANSQENQELDDNDEPSLNILMGDAVDLILTSGLEEFENQFVISDMVRPSGQQGTYAWELFVSGNHDTAWSKVGSKTKWETFEAKFNKIGDDGFCGRSYYEFLCSSKGKKVISNQDRIRIELVLESLKNNEYVNMFFTDSENDNWTNYYQVPIEFKYVEEDCKGLLDLIHVDHLKKELIPVDIKVTESSTTQWKWIFWKMRYDFQSSFYSRGMMLNPPEFIKKYLELGYTWKPFEFIVESYKYPGTPVRYICSEEVLKIGEFGGEAFRKTYEGFFQAIQRYKWHTEKELWNYPMEIYQGNGQIWLNTK